VVFGNTTLPKNYQDTKKGRGGRVRKRTGVYEMNVRRETRVDDDKLTNATARLVSTSLGSVFHECSLG